MTGHSVEITRWWRGSLAATLCFVLILLAVAAGGAAASTGHLYDPSVAPRTATAGSPVSLAVTFADVAGAAPEWVAVDLDGSLQPMAPASSDFLAGVRYTLSLKPAAGRYTVRFRARDASGSSQSAWGGYLTVVSAATPPPGPTATPAPTRTTSTTASPVATPRPSATATARPSSPTPTPTPTPSAHPSDGAGSSPSLKPGGEPSPAASAAPTPRAASGPGGAPIGGGPNATATPAGGPIAASTAAPTAAGSAAAAVMPPDGDDGATTIAVGRAAGLVLSGGASGAAPAAPGDQWNPPPGAPLSPAQLARALAPTIVTATVGTTLWAAFLMFGKKRRDDDEIGPSDQALAAAAASFYQVEAVADAAVVDEALLPRWRRPSLQQVRRSDPLRAAVDAPRLSFDSLGVRPLEDYERRQIAYRLVRLLDSPDDIRAQEIGVLDQGDEVQLLEQRGVYWMVLCPDGRTGWLHRMVLADPAQREDPSFRAAFLPGELLPTDGPAGFEVATEYAVADEATLDGTGEDLLAVYLRARGDVLRSLGDERFS